MPDILGLQRKKKKLVDEMREVLSLVEKEKRELTVEELKKVQDLDKQIRDNEERIKIDVRMEELEKQIELNGEAGGDGKPIKENLDNKPDKTGGFSNFGEFLFTIKNNKRDERLSRLYVEDYEKLGVTQKAAVGSLGGFMIPDQFSTNILSVTPQEAIFRPRMTMLPAGSPPDAKISIPALDQTSSQNMYGGITITYGGEGLQLGQTNLKLRKVELEPKQRNAYAIVTNKLLRNWSASSTLLEKQFRLAMIGADDTDFYSGSGVNRPTGILNAACRVEYSRATANQIAYADVLGMFARVKMGGPLVWIASQTTIPQLGNIRDTGNNNLWIQNSAMGLPATMFGYPLLFNERSVGLGTTGDLCLCDLTYYVGKMGSGPLIDMSEHLRFDYDETVFRIIQNQDADGWLTEPLPLEGSTTNTVSPFVILA